MSHRLILLAIACTLTCLVAPAAAEDLGLLVPAGFEVSLYADDALAHDIFSMTIDARGRVVVAGAGYVKILHDTDGDGRADQATLFSSLPASGAHGMFFDGPDLICTGDNAVMRQRDVDGDGRADGDPEIWTTLKHSEHGANGLVRGPDGCYYLACGNDAGVSEKQITTATSPVRHPCSGAFVRFSAEGKPLDVYAHGFRNPYDLDFDAAGHLLTVDSDGERDHHLPWYAPTRLFDIAQGMEHGWLLQGWMRGWNRPSSFFDNVERMVEIGRGSPTGVVAYRHRSFPVHYRGGVFSACWTLGRVYYFPLEASDATCKSRLEIFMQTTGDVGFAPVDLAVGPQGDLFVAIGGRHTRGGVFRVRYNSPAPEAANVAPLEQVLEADQPLSSWSRAVWVPIAKTLGKPALERAVENESLGVASRVRAVEVLVDLFGGFDPARAERSARSAPPKVRARVAWGLAHGLFSPTAEPILTRYTADAEPSVERAAWEALAAIGQIDPELPAQPDWSRALTSENRRVRAAAIIVARAGGQASYRKFLSTIRSGAPTSALRLADIWIRQPDLAADAQRPAFNPDDFRTCLEVFGSASSNSELPLEAVRLLQIGLGDLHVAPGLAEVYSGYAGNAVAQLDRSQRETIVGQLAPAFPTPDAELNRELARLLGMLGAESEGLLPAIARQWTQDSTVDNDFHYLIVASRLGGRRAAEVTAATAQCLLRLHGKLEALGQFPSRNWPFRASEVFEELCRRDSALADALVASGEFGHIEHALFVPLLPPAAQQSATRKLWAATAGQGQEPTSESIALVGRLPKDEALGLLEPQWKHVGLHDAIVTALARHPRGEDRSKFVEALASPQPAVVEKAARALVNLGMDCTSAEIASALRAFKQACALPNATEPRRSLLRLLDYWTEGNADIDDDPDPAKAYVGWFTMFAQYYPTEAARLRASSGADAQSWRRRLAQIDWPAGDVPRGRSVFERRTCHRCHEVSGHLGPDLKGAVSRMSRDDLFTAIFDPHLEVSPTYQTTSLATRSGQVYHGLIVYESPEGVLLQTGPDTTVRITDIEPASMRKSAQSLMPTGLLDTLSDQDLCDLYAYLKTLGAK